MGGIVMTGNEIANKAFDLVRNGDEIGYKNLLNSLTDEENMLFTKRVRQIQKLIESVNEIPKL